MSTFSPVIEAADTPEADADRSMLDNVMKNMPAVVCRAALRKDGAWRLLFAGAGLSDLVGPETAASLESDALRFESYLHPDDLTSLKDAGRDSLLTLSPLTHECRVRTDTGSYRWLQISARPTLCENGDSLWDGVLLDIDARKQSDKAQQAINVRFRKLLEATHVVPWEMDLATWRFTFIAPQATDLLGYPIEAWREPNFWQSHLHPDDCDETIQHCMEQTRLGLDHDLVYRMIGSEGQTVWIHDLVSVVGEENPPKTLRGVMIDVSAKMRTEQALRESESRLRLITDNAPDHIVQLNRKGVIEFVTRPLPGWTVQSMIGRHFSEWTPPEHLEIKQKSFERAVATGKPQQYEAPCVDRNGQQQWYSCRLNPVVIDGEVVSLIGVARDTTERRRVEQTLHLTKFAVENAAEAMFTIASDGRFLNVNETACRRLGYTREELLKLSVPDIDPLYRRDSWPRFWSDMRAQASYSFETIHRTREGREFPVEVSIAYFEFDGVEHCCAFARDITERLKCEQRRRMLMRELDHRVKNNLASVLALAKWTRSSTKTLDEFGETFEGRIRAMLAMHEALARENWDHIELGELAHLTLGFLMDRTNMDRIAWEGEKLTLPARAASPLCMTLHELATNAAKHGALSHASGRVQLRWSIKSDEHSDRVRLVWEETGSPSAAPSCEKEPEQGAGFELMRGFVTFELGGEIEFQFKPDGLRCVISFQIGRDRDEHSLAKTGRCDERDLHPASA